MIVPLFALFASSLAFPAVKRCGAQTWEAEDAALSGTEILTDLSGYSGSGYVGGFDEASDKITFSVDSSSQKLYDVTIRYAAPYGEKTTTVTLNGGTNSAVFLPATDSWEDVNAGQLLLNEGINTIDIVNNWGWYLIDSLSLSEAGAAPDHDINPTLVNPNANADAVALYDYLRSIYGTKILSGQQDLEWTEWLAEQTGKTPALVAVDLMDYSPSRVERMGQTATTVEDAITFDAKGGIVSVLWHWNAPAGLYDTEENRWWSGFYTRATSFNVATALADPDGEDYRLIIRDIDAISEELLRLQEANVPVLWRPLHEAEGKWFWWGAQGPEACKQLWELMYDRMTNHHGLNNLIWVWNSIAPEWYPDPNTVDILAADVYATGNGPMSSEYNRLIELGNDQKMVAATEVGSAPDPAQLQAYQAHWLWFAVWTDGFINSPDYNPPQLLNSIYNDEYVLTLDEITGWRG